jgi:gas vesicle protein
MLTLDDLQQLVDRELPLQVFLDRHEKNSEGAFPLVVGIATGVLIGAAVGILFTPRTGKELRSRLAQHTVEPVEHIVERASSASHDAREQVERISSAARVRMQSAVHRQPTTDQRAAPAMNFADLDANETLPPAPRKGWLDRLKERFHKAVGEGKEAARERAAEERARYREMTKRPDALSDAETVDED